MTLDRFSPSLLTIVLIIPSWSLPQTSAKVAKIIEGSSISLYCPFGPETVAFGHHPELGQSLGRIDKGRLQIQRVTNNHNGTYTCCDSSGNEIEIPERIDVVPNPGRYKIKLKIPKLTLNGNFQLDCDLEYNDGDRTFALFLMGDEERLPTNVLQLGRNKYRFSYKRPDRQVQLCDDGRKVQCVARNRYGHPCCERSRTQSIFVEVPHKTVMTSKEGHQAPNNNQLAIVLSLVALVIVVSFSIIYFVIKRQRKKGNYRVSNSVYNEEAQDEPHLLRNMSGTSEFSNGVLTTRL